MAPSPASRYPSAAALADDIRAWLDGRRVGAYAYSPMESLRRFARAWRIPLMVAGAAALALLVGGIVATGEIMAERDRAVTAEELASASEAKASALLAESLTAQAGQHLEAGRGAEAAVLAAHAMAYGENPRARGVLAATAAMGLPLGSHHLSLPTSCVNPRLGRSGRRVLCGAGDAIEAWVLEDGAPRRLWRAEMPHAAAVWGPAAAGEADDARLSVIDASRSLLTLDAETGRVVDRAPGEVAASRRFVDVIQRPGEESVLSYSNGWHLSVHDARGGAGDGHVCPANVHVEAAASAGAKVAVICADGSAALYRIGNGGGLERVLTYAESATDESGAGFMAALSSDDRLIAVTPRGRIHVRDASGSHHADTAIVGATGLALSHDGRWLAISTVRAGVHVVSASIGDLGAPRARIPAPHDLAVRWESDGRLLTVGTHEVVMWDLDMTGWHRLVMAGGHGLSTLDVGEGEAGGARVVVGGGDGVLGRVVGVPARLSTAIVSDAVLKRVRLDRNTGRAAEGGRAPVWFSTANRAGVGRVETVDAAPRTLTTHAPLRRIEQFADGSWFGAGWIDGPVVLGRDGKLASGPEGDPAFDVAPSPDRMRMFYLVEEGAKVMVMEPGGASRELARVPGARCVAATAGEVLVATDGAVVTLGASTGREIARWDIAPLIPTDLAVDGAGRVAIGSRDGAIAVYRVEPGGDRSDRAARLEVWIPAGDGGHTERIGELAFAGDVLYSASWDGTLRRWCLAGSAIRCDAARDANPAHVEAALRLDLNALFQRAPARDPSPFGAPSVSRVPGR